MAATVHEVFAIFFARNDEPTRGHLMLGAGAEPADAPMPLAYYAWVIRSTGLDVVVDVGFTAATNGPRPRRLIERPSEALARLGVDSRTVPLVILTHFHNDHVGELEAFPAATFLAQRAEFEFWTSEDAWLQELSKHAEKSDVARLVALHEAGRLKLLDGAFDVADGITVHPVGGHTPGMQIVSVRTSGGTVVLASDASHFFENLETLTPAAVNLDPEAAGLALARMIGLADGGVLVAGHDPGLVSRFPAVPGLEGRALRIA